MVLTCPGHRMNITVPSNLLATSIEVNTLNRPRIPSGSEPRDDDPTGVRALLSSLPEPDPMPEHLVARINASLAAEQAERAARMTGDSVTPLVTTARRRPRLLFAVAGAAAAVVLVAVVGSNMLTGSQGTTSATSAGITSTSRAASTLGTEAGGAAAPSAAGKDQTPKALTGPASAPPTLVQIGLSGTRYTRADFVTQARKLHQTSLDSLQLKAAGSSGAGPAGTTRGLMECLAAIGAGEAQVVRADLAFYEGRPAVIIVATTGGVPVAYVVGRQCSRTDAAVLRPATPLP